MGLVHRLLSIPVILQLFNSAVQAEPIKLDSNGRQELISFSKNKDQQITAYVLTQGNETQFVTFRVQAPKGTSVTAKAILMGSANELDLINKTSGWSDAQFLSSTGSESKTLVLGGKNRKGMNRRISSSEFYCGNSTAADLDEVIQVIQETQGVTYTRDQVCAEYGYPVIGSDAPLGDVGRPIANGSVAETVQVIVRKNTCSVKPSATYLVRFDLNFSSVSANDLTQASEIYLGATPIKYTGSKASSLKPVSDGQYSPRPLFLMATTGGAREKFSLAKWSKNKVSLTTLKIVATANWRGHSLIRVLADSVLKGGTGVAEVQSEVGVYSVCFKLTRTRQKYNGYS